MGRGEKAGEFDRQTNSWGSDCGVVVVKGQLQSSSAHTNDTFQHQVSSQCTDDLRFLILLFEVVKR